MAMPRKSQFALLCSFIFACVIIAILTAVLVASKSIGPKKPWLTQVLANMDKRASPCEDFHRYACGHWEANAVIPKGQSTVKSYTYITDSLNKFTKETLEGRKGDGSVGLSQAQTYFASCMDTKAVEKLRFTPLENTLKSLFKGWYPFPPKPSKKSFDLTNALEPLVRLFGATPFFELSVSNDQRKKLKFRLYIAGINLGLKRSEYVDNSKTVTAYKQYIQDYAQKIGLKKNMAKQLQDVYSLEAEIAKLSTDEPLDVNVNYMTLKNLQEKCPAINWVNLLSKAFSEMGYKFTASEEVGLGDMELLFKRCKLIQQKLKTPDGVLNMNKLLIWSVLRQLADFLPKSVSVIHDKLTRVLKGTTAAVPQHQKCLDLTNRFYEQVIARKYVETVANVGIVSTGKTMLQNLQKEMENTMRNITWMNLIERQTAIGKLKKIEMKIGYPDYLLNKATENKMYFSLKMKRETFLENSMQCLKHQTLNKVIGLKTQDHSKWTLMPTHVQLAFHESSNEISLPAVIWQPPFYSKEAPIAMNYGAMGSSIGHEITHAFDSFGSMFTAEGIRKVWWSKQTTEQFNNKMKCFVDQYNKYVIKGKKVNGAITEAENFADALGVQISFEAYKALTKTTRQTMAKSDKNGLTDDQLFFIAYAQIYCDKTNTKTLHREMATSVHTPSPYRVIGALSNVKAFATTFNCPANSKMNPTKKCTFW